MTQESLEEPRRKRREQPNVSVIVTTYRRPREISRLLESLDASTEQANEVVIVNNDPSAPLALEAEQQFPVTVLQGGFGLNLAAARNLGVQKASAEVCVIVDDDNRFCPGTIAALKRAFESPSVEFAAPVILAGDSELVWCGGVQRSHLTTRTTMKFNGLSQRDLPETASWHTEDMPDCFAIRRRVFARVGGLDAKTFPFHYDEADFGERLRNQGVTPYVIREAMVRHDGFVMTDDPGAAMIEAYRRHGRQRVVVMVRARAYFHRRHGHGLSRMIALGIGLPVWLAISIAGVVRRERSRETWAIIAAMMDGMRHGLLDHLAPPPVPWSDPAVAS